MKIWIALALMVLLTGCSQMRTTAPEAGSGEAGQTVPPPPPPPQAPPPAPPPQAPSPPALPEVIPRSPQQVETPGSAPSTADEVSVEDVIAAIEAQSGDILDSLPSTAAGRPPPLDDSSAGAEPQEQLALRTVDVFYGTNRARGEACRDEMQAGWQSRRCSPNVFYSGTVGSALEVGTFTVSFPPDHQTGAIERPLSILTVSFRDEDPEVDVVITRLNALGDDFERWARQIDAVVDDATNEAFIYVHGYATSFEDAARRAAQVAFDLDLDVQLGGIPMLFSWPSRGTTTGYVSDLDAADDSTAAFNAFIDLVRQKTRVSKVHLIAHSMGNRVVTEALGERLLASGSQQLFDELVLAAPDVPARRFKERFLEQLPKLARRTTLYVADDDVALYVSRSIREQEPRAGQVASGLLDVAVAGFDAINASSLTRDFLAHSYYANNDSMLSDIYCLLQGASADRRPLIEPVGPAWQFRTGRPADGAVARCLSPIVVEERSAWWVWLVVVFVAIVSGYVLWRRRSTALSRSRFSAAD